MLAFPRSWKGVLQQDTFLMHLVGVFFTTKIQKLGACYSVFPWRISILFLTVLPENWIPQQMDTMLGVKKEVGYYLLCSYLLAEVLGQMLEWHLEPVTLPFLDPRRFLSQVFAESASLTVSDLADAEFFSPQWHSFNRRGGEWPTQEHPIAWQLQRSPRRWEMWIGYPLGKEGNCGRSKFNLGECLSLKAIV